MCVCVGGYVLLAEIERLLKDPHADLFIGRIPVA